jgi:hypothetical protein
VICLALIAFAGVAFLALNRFSQSNDPFREKYVQIRQGMTRQQVEDELGSPDMNVDMGAPRGHICYWLDGDRAIGIEFSWDSRGERTGEIVIGKWFRPMTASDQFESTIAAILKAMKWW